MPTAKEDEVRQDVQRKFEMARLYRQPRDRTRAKSWHGYYNQFYKEGQEDERHSKPVIPKTWSSAQTRLAHLTTQRPTIKAYPYQPGHKEMAEVVSRALMGVQDVQRVQNKRSLGYLHADVSGQGVLKVGWDEDFGPQGEVDVSFVDEFNFWLDREATSIDNAIRCFHAQNISKTKLEWEFRGLPDVLERLKEVDGGPLYRDLTTQIHTLANQSGTGPNVLQDANATASSGHNPLGAASPGKEDDQMVSLIEMWEKRVVEGVGKIWVTLIANNTVLRDEESPFNDGEFPFTIYEALPDGKQTYPSGMVEQGLNIQQAIHKTEGKLQDLLALVAQPVLLVPTESGLDPRTLRVEAGAAYPFEGGNEARPSWLTPGSISPELFLQRNALGQTYDDNMGNLDVLKGQRPPGIEAARAIEALAQKASVRLDRQAQWYEDGENRLGKLIWNRIKQFYQDERVIKSISEDGELIHTVINQPDETGQIVRKITEDLDFDIRFELAPSLPANRLQTFNQAVMLYQLGAFGPPGHPISIKHLLKAAHWPNANKILQDVTEMLEKQQEAEQAAQAQQQQPQQGAPPG